MPSSTHKTCFFTWDDPSFVSGCRTWIERLLPELVGHKIEPSVVYLPSPDGKANSHIQALRAAGINCHPLPTIFPWNNANITAVLRDTLADIAPDTFVPNFWAPGYLAAAELRDIGIETIGVLHSDDPYYWDIVQSTLTIADARQRITHWAAVSKYLAEELENRNRPRRYLRVKPIPAGVCPSERIAKYPTSGPFRIGYFGRIVTEQKRILDVAAAMRDICHAFPNACCEIYGKGDQETELIDWLKKHAPDVSVHYRGCLSPSESINVMGQMHAVLLLSDYEGLSVTLMESMAAGVPVISYACRSGTDELIQNGANGFIVTDRSKQVVHAIGSLLNDPRLWNRISKAAVRTIHGRFSVHSNALDWARLLRHATRYPQGRWKAFCSLLPFFDKVPEEGPRVNSFPVVLDHSDSDLESNGNPVLTSSSYKAAG